MAYRILVDGELLWDAVTDTDVVSSASISQSVNAAAYLDMEVAPDAAPRIAEGSSEIEVRWGDETLFHGRATEVSQGIDGTWSVTAVSEIDRLNDVLVRPHSTSGEVGERCPDTVGGYFGWLIERYNERAVGGYRIDVRVNQGDQLSDGAVSVSDDSWPTVAAAVEDVVLSRGGYLDFTPYSGGGVIDLYADLHDASAQVVDLGENVTDITVTRSTEEQRTALVPYGTDDDGNEWTLSGASEADLQLALNAGCSVMGDAIYIGDYVAEYGYREERHEFPGVASVAELVRAAVPYLRTMVAPTLTVECRAVDMALYRDGYRHLRVGQAVRVRSEPHGVDEYLAVQDVQLDLSDPSQTTYTLGVSYDTLTGNQSEYLSKLNGSINSALDRVQGVVDGIGNVVNDVDVEYYVSDSPDEPVGGEWGVGTVTAVDNKYVFSHLKQEQADGTIVVSDPTLLTPSVQRSLKLHRDVGDSPVWVAFIAANVDVTDNEDIGLVRLSGQMGGWDASEQGAVTVAFGLQDADYGSGSGGKAGVGVVTEKSSDIDTSKVDIQSYVDNGRVGIYVMLTGEVTVSLYAEGGGFSTPFVELGSEPSGTRVFSLADTQTTYESAILQADNALKLYVSANYATKDALGSVESAFDIRADQIQAQVTEKMDTAVANQTFVNQSTFSQFSDSITTTVQQTQQTASSAASAASSAQQDAADAVTKTSQLQQTVSGLSSTVSEVKTTAEGAYEKASKVEQDVSGVTITLTKTTTTANQAAEDAESALKAASDAQDSANSAQSTASSAQKTANSAQQTASSAQQAASSAQSAASSAQQTANSAQQAAEDAAKVATNYLRFDSSGLCVGNMTGSLGYNALITSSQYQIRNGSTVLSSFGASQINLGQNSTSSVVSLCGSKGSIRYGSGSTSWGATRNYLDIRGSSGGNVLMSVTGSNDDASGMQTAFVELDGPSQVAAIAGKNGTYIGTSKVNNGDIMVLGRSFTYNGSNVLTDNVAYVSNGWNVLRVGKLVICSRTWRSSSNMACNIAWGSWLYSNLVQLPAYPVTFAAAPASHVEYVAGDDGANGDGIVLRQGPGKTASRPGSVYLVRPSGAAYTFGHPTFAITAIGTVA